MLGGLNSIGQKKSVYASFLSFSAARYLRSDGIRKTRLVIVLLIVFGLLLALVGVTLLSRETASKPDAFVGVSVAYGGEEDVYKIADAIQGYTNLIILGSLNVTSNTATLTRVCDYLDQKGFYFIVYVGSGDVSYLPPRGPNDAFFEMAAQRWGDKFLGAYMFDEPGGKQMDYSLSNPDKPVSSANDGGAAAIHYIITINTYLNLYKNTYYNAPQMRLFTSDYALYWYDYLCGYDVVLGEVLGNDSGQVTVALTRGAAETHGKEWGTIITWSCVPGPCLENGTELYNHMVLAYDNGAKYIAVFDGPGNYGSLPTTPYGILTTEHLDAMKDFWNYAKAHPQPEKNPAETAYVLPRDYGYGFRGANDSIWGLWSADSLSLKIWNDTNILLATYGMKLDIVCETRIGDVPINLAYDTLIFWNGTTIRR